MAGFHTKTFDLHDDYMTPLSAWQAIAHLLPTDKVIWEGFYGNGQSLEYLQQLGFNAVGGKGEDFFEHDKGDICVSNPPFSIAAKVLQRLVDIDKPFILILPASKINTQYFRKLFSDSMTGDSQQPKQSGTIQIIIPRKRIQFDKIVNGEKVESGNCNFDCFYYCYKMNYPRDIIWLE